MVKKCIKCNVVKEAGDFHKNRAKKDGLQSWCKQCLLGHMKNRRANTPNILLIEQELRIQSREKFPGRMSAASARWQKAHPEKVAAASARYRNNHPERVLDSMKRWRRENPDKTKEWMRRHNKKVRSTPRGQLNHNLSSAMYRSLCGHKTNRHWETLVGYTVGQLMEHLEKLFKPGWTWENYGTVWQIDHKIPIAVFNYEHPGDLDFRICWSLKNLQPMDKIDNAKKGTKMEEPFQPSLLMCEC